MSRAVMLSIRPKWCEMIASGKKTVEIRKTRPKIKPPFKCYIYCTIGGDKFGWLGCYDHDYRRFGRIHPQNIETGKKYNIEVYSGKVIGEFVCDGIEEYLYDYCTHPEIGKDYDCGDSWWEIDKEDLKRACMTYEQFKEYAMPNKDCMFGWHISDLVIYDTPLPLTEFVRFGWRETFDEWEHYSIAGVYTGPNPNVDDWRITRPPQSWCYVEEET